MLQTAAALVLFLFPLAFSPGPGNLFFAANSARFGFKATIPANIGYHSATWCVTAAIGFGFIAAFADHPQVFMALKIAGAIYVLWLAWRLFGAGTLQAVESGGSVTFGDGVVLLVLNPKAYVIIALMFTQFLGAPGAGQTALVIWITCIFTLNNLVAFCVWGLIGDRLARHFRTAQSALWLNRVFGAMLAAVAVWMVLA